MSREKPKPLRLAFAAREKWCVVVGKKTGTPPARVCSEGEVCVPEAVVVARWCWRLPGPAFVAVVYVGGKAS